MSQSSQKFPDILGDKIRQAREAVGISIEELARKAALSKRQLEQIENGGNSCFYSYAIKINAAKKIAKMLGMDEADIFSP